MLKSFFKKCMSHVLVFSMAISLLIGSSVPVFAASTSDLSTWMSQNKKTTSTPKLTATNKSVRVFWLRPYDVPYDQKVVDGLNKVMLEAQRYYKKELGKTFKLNSPIVEVCVGDHNRQWYETNSTLTTDPYFRPGFNMLEELKRKYGLLEGDSRYVSVGEISAEGDGAGGFGGNGWVCLTKHDLDGAAGINGPMNRWYGGMIHELGHAFGLPDSTYTDGTPMSASFYDYPNCHFTQAQKRDILNNYLYGSFFN